MTRLLLWISSLALISVYDPCLSDYPVINPLLDPLPVVLGVCPLQKTQPITDMDPAELRSAMTSHGSLLGDHDSQIRLLAQSLNELSIRVDRTRPPSQDPSHGSGHVRPVQLATPEKFDGSPDGCDGFLVQCSLYFAHQPAAFSDDGARIAFVITLLRGRALQWASAIWSRGGELTRSFTDFTNHFREVFDHPAEGRSAGDQLLALRQGSQSAADYAMRFRTLAAASGWNDPALLAIFRQGLSRELQSELACRDQDADLSFHSTIHSVSRTP